jgi:hypothetical protein
VIDAKPIAEYKKYGMQNGCLPKLSIPQEDLTTTAQQPRAGAPAAQSHACGDDERRLGRRSHG